MGRANDVFHQVIQKAAGNDVLRLTLTHLHRNFRRDLSRIVPRESSALLRKNVSEHEAILGAIEQHDVEAARRR